MTKRIVILLLSILSFSCFASSCPRATPHSNPGFCASFKTSAQCHCTSSGLPAGMCTNMKSLYDRMTSMFGSLRRACEFQHDTSVQDCIDGWTCYRLGGKTTSNELCSGTGRACE